MQESNGTEVSYSPSMWGMTDSVGQEYTSPFDSQRIGPPLVGTPLNTQDGRDIREPANEQPQPRKRRKIPRTRLPLLCLDEWDREGEYDEDPPTCVHYSVDWTVMLDHQQISQNSERNVVLGPASFWLVVLRSRLEKVVEKKMSHVQNVRAFETNVVVNVTARGVHDFVNEFEGLDINWREVSSQLTDWSGYFQDGKQLRIKLTFHYRSLDQSATSADTPRRSGRGRPPTQQMRQERNARVIAEEETEGRAAIWTTVYRIMRCPTACPKGPHCFVDENDPEKTHYKMYTDHFRQIIRHMLDKKKFESPADIPDGLRRQLYDEAARVATRKRTLRATSPSGPTPVTINHCCCERHVPGLSLTASLPAEKHSSPDLLSPVIVTGHHDAAVHDYSTWLQSTYQRKVCKEAVIAAEDIVQQRMLGLDHLHKDRKWQFLVDAKVPEGVARRFVCDIKKYFKHLHHEGGTACASE